MNRTEVEGKTNGGCFRHHYYIVDNELKEPLLHA